MSFEVKIIEDAHSVEGDRLTAFQLRYPRYVLAELNTHRVLSRSSASSRAIPTETMIERIRADTARPISWGQDQRGMQAGQELNELIWLPVYTEQSEYGGSDESEWEYKLEDRPFSREAAWDYARDWAITVATAFDAAGYHKQVVNRLLEPFTHVSTIVTATEFSNWFELRSHKDADPVIKNVSDLMLDLYKSSNPTLLRHGQWFLPYVTWEERLEFPVTTLKKFSTARCARVSFNNHDGTAPDHAKDLSLYDRLVGARPLHASPAEHQGSPDIMLHRIAITDDYGSYEKRVWRNERMHGNFTGFIQHRKILELDVFK